MVSIVSMDVQRLEGDLGQAIRGRRESRGLTRAELARLANVSEGAVKNLELAYGANVTTLVRVVHALDGDAWLTALAPTPTFDPFAVFERASRERAAGRSRRGVAG